jgi:hypothetical protein
VKEKIQESDGVVDFEAVFIGYNVGGMASKGLRSDVPINQDE